MESHDKHTDNILPTTISAQIPASSVTMSVSIIDTTSYLVGAAGSSVMPMIPGQRFLNFDSYCFLLEHSITKRRFLFDAGSRVDWWNLSPNNIESIHESLPGLCVVKSVNQILREGGTDDTSIDAIIWSHPHFDHIGNSSLFPASTEIIVGPNFKEEFTPTYPTDPEADLLESDLADRTVQELDFENDSIKVGDFRAKDFLEDGSIYLLDTPGHCAAHISALVRTTASTFILLGGDICDTPQVLRPTTSLPLPAASRSRLCSHLRGCDPRKPFSQVSDSSISFYEDPVVSQQSVDALQAFDADENIFVALAHDRSLRSALLFFPHGTINDWKVSDWKAATTWEFLNHLPLEDNVTNDAMIVDGLHREGQKLRSAEEIIESLETEMVEQENAAV